MNEEKDNENRFLPDIDTYLEGIENKWSVSINGMDELIEKIIINSTLSKDASEQIVRLFFQEIRNQIIKGNEITIKKLGRLYISCPKNSNNKQRVFTKFEPANTLVDELNDDTK